MQYKIPDPIELAKALIRHDTCNPPGNEEPVVRLLENMLAEAGFATKRHNLKEGRPSLIAQLPGPTDSAPFVLCGHLDTVPAGGLEWTDSPFSASVKNGRLYGRGASDMKSGVAALTTAAMEHARQRDAGIISPQRGLTLVFTAGEETGCEGALQMAADGVLGQAHAVIVAEPTCNVPCLGHKGVLWVRMQFHGTASHGSMPELGDNAITKAARAVLALENFFKEVPSHPQLGKPTITVNTVGGRHKVNIVPDNAFLEIDMRPLPGMEQEDIIKALYQAIPDPCEISVLNGQQGIWTEEKSLFVQSALAIVGEVTGTNPEAGSVSYFTDTSALLSAYGSVPAIICGPGDPVVIHKPNEWCALQEIVQAMDIYVRLCAQWTR